jgi:hypothetical protein
MMTEEELAQAHTQLDMLVQPEGNEALEAMMAYIRELQQRIAQADVELELWLVSTPDGDDIFLKRIQLDCRNEEGGDDD